MVSEETMLKAVLEVKEKERSVRAVSEEFGISRKTLGRYCAKFKTSCQPTQQTETEPQSPQPIALDEIPQPGGVPKIFNTGKKPWDKFGYDKRFQV